MTKRSIAHPRTGAVDPPSLTGRVYVASPMSTYDTPEYDAKLDRLVELLPRAELIPARGLFDSNTDWRRKWPTILPTLQAVVCFADDDGYVGFGVWTELTDALARGVPVRYLTPDGRLHEIATDDDGEVIVSAFRPWDWRQFAVIAYKLSGEDASRFLAAYAKGGV